MKKIMESKQIIITNKNPNEIKTEGNYDKEFQVWRIDVELKRRKKK